MKRHYFLLLGLLVSTLLSAQSIPGKTSVRLGADLTSLDAPDDVAPRFVGRLAYHFAHDRIVVAAEMGYLSVVSPNRLFNAADPGPDYRKRLTTDLTAFYDLIRHPNHALRIGVGVSAWGRSDDLYRGARMTDAQNVVIDRKHTTALNTGGHVATEYEWRFSQYWAVDVRLRMANLQEAGISSSLGVGVSCRF